MADDTIARMATALGFGLLGGVALAGVGTSMSGAGSSGAQPQGPGQQPGQPPPTTQQGPPSPFTGKPMNPREANMMAIQKSGTLAQPQARAGVPMSGGPQSTAQRPQGANMTQDARGLTDLAKMPNAGVSNSLMRTQTLYNRIMGQVATQNPNVGNPELMQRGATATGGYMGGNTGYQATPNQALETYFSTPNMVR